MTRDDFMAKARGTTKQILESKENGIMNLVQQAWAEGKRNAEVETLKQAVVEAFTNRTATVDKSCEVGYEEKIPDNEDDCVLLYKGQKIRCKMGMISVGMSVVYPEMHKRKFEVYEV